MYKCKQCFIEFKTELKCEGFCTWYCRFMSYHNSEDSKKAANMKEWFRLNDLMREEKEQDKYNNKVKKSKNITKKFNNMKNKEAGLLIQRNYRSETDHTRSYNTRLYETFNHCECAGFKNRGDCKHVQDLNNFYKLLTQ